MAGDDLKDAQGRRLRRARERMNLDTATAGWEHVKATTRSPLSSTTYLQHENGTRSLRGKADLYAQAFGVPAGWLVWGHSPPDWAGDGTKRNERDLTNVKLAVEFLEVRYRARAGHWVEVGADAPIEQIEHGTRPDPRYSQWPQWLELVEGDSANLKVQDGMYVHVVDAMEMGYRPKTGDWVIAERRRDQGATRERTVKQVEVAADGSVLLWPRSTNPKWNKPLDMSEGCRPGEEGVEVAIVAKVIAAIDTSF